MGVVLLLAWAQLLGLVWYREEHSRVCELITLRIFQRNKIRAAVSNLFELRARRLQRCGMDNPREMDVDRNNELFAEAFANNDLENRHQHSIYRGSEEITTKNMHRHMVKHASMQNLRKLNRLKQTVAKVMLANYFTATMAQKRSAETEAAEAAQPPHTPHSAEIGTPTSPTSTPTSQIPGGGSPVRNRKLLPKAASLSDMSKAIAEANAPSPKKKNSKKRRRSVSGNLEHGPTSLLDDLRDLYDPSRDETEVRVRMKLVSCTHLSPS